MLTLDQILNINDIETEEVEIPEWGGSVKVKAMSGAERDKYLKMVMGKDGKPDMQKILAKLVIMTVVNEENELMFNNGHMDMLNKKSAKALEKISKVSMRLAGLTQDDIEEAVKN